MSSDRTCCLCSQIRGEPASDLIAALLPGQPYTRRVLLESGSLAAIPSLGPIAPGHSLLCPKDHIRSFAALDHRLDSEFTVLKENLREVLTGLYGAPVHLFEHGMAMAGTRVPCTVEHAHLHFLPLPGDIIDPRELGQDGQWLDFTGSLPELRALTAGSEYIYHETPERGHRVLRSTAGTLESQYMRKAFARLVGRVDEWDWRVSPNAELADQTWRHFTGSGVTI